MSELERAAEIALAQRRELDEMVDEVMHRLDTDSDYRAQVEAEVDLLLADPEIQEAIENARKPRERKWSTYMFIGSDTTVLYVGMTGRGFMRLAAHRSREWWDDVEEIHLEHFATEAEARRRETVLIRQFCPKHNIAQRPPGRPGVIAHSNMLMSLLLNREEAA